MIKQVGSTAILPSTARHAIAAPWCRNWICRTASSIRGTATAHCAGDAAASSPRCRWRGCMSRGAWMRCACAGSTPASRGTGSASAAASIHTHHQRRPNPSEYGYNVGCLEGVDPLDLGPVPTRDGVQHPADR